MIDRKWEMTWRAGCEAGVVASMVADGAAGAMDDRVTPVIDEWNCG